MSDTVNPCPNRTHYFPAPVVRDRNGALVSPPPDLHGTADCALISKVAATTDIRLCNACQADPTAPMTLNAAALKEAYGRMLLTVIGNGQNLDVTLPESISINGKDATAKALVEAVRNGLNRVVAAGLAEKYLQELL